MPSDELPVTAQCLTSRELPRDALIPFVPPVSVMPFAITPSIAMRRAPSRRSTGWVLSRAMMVAEAMPFVLIVTSSRVRTMLSVHVPLTRMTRGVTSTFRIKALLIVSPGRLQLTLTFASTATPGNAQNANTTMAACNRRQRVRSWFMRGVPPDGGWWWPTWTERPYCDRRDGSSSRCPTGKKRARRRTPETAAYPNSCQWPTMQGFALSGRTFHCLGKFVQIGGATGEHGEDGHQAARATWIMHVWPGSSARPHRC